MQTYQEGDPGKAICFQCSPAVVTTTYRFRDVALGTDPQRSQHLLVAVCDECDQMVGLPAQSTPNAAVAPSQALIPTATTTSMFSDREIEESLAISALAKAAMDSPREHELTAEELDVEGELIKCSLGLQCGTH